MLKKTILGLLLLNSVVLAKESFPEKTRSELLVLKEDFEILHFNMNNLTKKIENLQSDIDLLKSNSNSFSDAQIVKIKETAKGIIGEEGFMENIDQRINKPINELSSIFSSEMNMLSDKIQNVFNRIIAFLGAQQKLVNSVTNTFSKQSDGIVHEVKAGETLTGIAAKYGVTVELVKSLNFIINESHLPEGQMLFIPQKK